MFFSKLDIVSQRKGSCGFPIWKFCLRRQWCQIYNLSKIAFLKSLSIYKVGCKEVKFLGHFNMMNWEVTIAQNAMKFQLICYFGKFGGENILGAKHPMGRNDYLRHVHGAKRLGAKPRVTGYNRTMCRPKLNNKYCINCYVFHPKFFVFHYL